MTLLAHAGGADEIVYALSGVILLIAVWFAFRIVREQRAERDAAPPDGDPDA